MRTADMPGALYRLEYELGSGGDGTVYKAWHNRMRRHVAVKIGYPSRYAHSGASVRAYGMETIKTIKCRYLPRVYELTEEDNRLLTVMEFVNGENFGKLLEDGRRFCLSDAARWYGQLACAVEALHKHGVCHCDIKPSNIMLTPHFDALLIDFGSARSGGGSECVISRSSGYTPPEQLALYERIAAAANAQLPGGKPYCVSGGIDWVRADIYSLGAAMCHIITGRHPQEQTDKLTDDFTPDSHTAPLMEIINRSMSRRPADRYASARELRGFLREARKGNRFSRFQIPSRSN